MAQKNTLEDLFNTQDLSQAILAQDKHLALELFEQKVFFFRSTPCGNPAKCPNLELMSVFLNALNIALFNAALTSLGCNLQKCCFMITNTLSDVTTLKSFILKGQDLITAYLHEINLYISENGRCQHRSYISKAKEYIENNITQSFTLEDVANEIFISQTYLSHLFNNLTGMTYSSYVTSVKVDMAKRLLLTTDDSINDIAIKCGFNQAGYFATTFKKVVGVTPKQFRVSMLAVG